MPPESIRKRSSRRLAWLGLALALCADAAQAGPAGNVLRIGNGAEPQTLDPHKTETVDGSRIVRDLCEGLTIVSPKGETIPGAAESWQISPDGLEYIFFLRPQARWSNGDPVVAEDFVAGLRRAADPKTGSSYAQMLEPLLNAPEVITGKKPPDSLGVEAVDDHTLLLRLRGPTPYLLGMLSHTTTFPIHRPSLKQYGDQFARPGHMVCNGAYTLDDWVVQSHVRIQRNRHYWNDAQTHIDTVMYYATEDQNSELKAYRAGDLDWATGYPVIQTPWIRKNLPAEFKMAPYLGISYFGYNLTRAPFKDNLKLRQALSLAIDRDIIGEKVLYGLSLPSYGWIPPRTEGVTPQTPAWSKWTQAQRLALARKLYAEAGYSKEHPAEVEIRYNTSENNKRVSVVVAAMWKQWLGVKSTLVNEEWKVFLNTRKLKKKTQVFRSAWIGDYNDASTFLDIMQSTHGQNDTGWSNAQYDALLVQAAAETDPLRRQAQLEQAERILLEDLPMIPLTFYVSKNLVKPWVRQWQDNILDYHYSKDMRIEGY
ncbi:peptide ABC transporter substrate-binding protein [Solimonas sp. K1W22B-7]|uniref:peptide ABC transporter substrate-binding protein n=1 Tax=Solimonas sp. K1W22B-7 TaxID=2303331 RepID=UPI000E330475|nr:peptide ABC transporter substrate-binding protein [Solimonas sp. K1W22B-7]AXQ30801.1 peptide ABC transporter substrate-binding protein [Solimonas sp. K1W22B-7]